MGVSVTGIQDAPAYSRLRRGQARPSYLLCEAGEDKKKNPQTPHVPATAVSGPVSGRITCAVPS